MIVSLKILTIFIAIKLRKKRKVSELSIISTDSNSIQISETKSISYLPIPVLLVLVEHVQLHLLRLVGHKAQLRHRAGGLAARLIVPKLSWWEKRKGVRERMRERWKI